MPRRSPMTHAANVRHLLNLVIKTRSQYASFLSQVAKGERPIDDVRKNCLKGRCDVTLNAWRAARRQWHESSWTPPPPPP